MKWICRFLFILNLLLIGGRSFTPATPEEQVLKKAFAAIRSEDWEEFAPLMNTSADFQLVEGGDVPFRIFSIKVRQDGIERDTRDLAPLFMIVRWHKECRILRVEFPMEKGAAK